jgi:tripartite-type tricarboxylate transporter receptor subunit TctC
MKCAFALIIAAALSAPAVAQDVAAFYAGKTIMIYGAGGVGGPYDIYGRTLDPYLRKYLPGAPSVQMQAMPGAGGTRAANYVYSVAPKDGTALGFFLPTIAVNQAVGVEGIKYDAAKFNYIASVEPLDQAVFVQAAAPVKTLADARRAEAALGSTGRTSATWIVPALMNQFLGTKFKIVTGYPGASDVMLAMERGEVHGLALNWAAIAGARPQWKLGEHLHGLAQSGLARSPDLPDVPTMTELASGETEKRALEFYALSAAFGRVIAAPPGVPAERVAALRTALDKTLTDPDFLKDAQSRGLVVAPTPAAEVERIVARTLATPAAVREKVKEFFRAE